MFYICSALNILIAPCRILIHNRTQPPCAFLWQLLEFSSASTMQSQQMTRHIISSDFQDCLFQPRSQFMYYM